jgi:hypothetical protein
VGLSDVKKLLYLAAGPADLAERWLDSLALDAEAGLLMEPGAEDTALAFQQRYAGVQEVRRLPEGGVPNFEPPDESVLVTVPLALYSVPLDYKPHLALPELQPHYPVFRKLWRLGYRHFELYSLAGSRRLNVPHLLDAFEGTHRGRRCFVVGNGPSLNAVDMTKLKDELTFGSNRCYLGFEQWGAPFTFWGIYDHFQVQEYHREYEAKVPPECVKLVAFDYLPLLRMRNVCALNVAWPRQGPHQFSASPDAVFAGFTVTHMLMQAAACMGCNPIVLIGCDHRYDLRRRPFFKRKKRQVRRWLTRTMRGTRAHRVSRALRLERLKAQGRAPETEFWTTRDAKTATHFDPGYTGGEQKRFVMPEPELAEGDFRAARRYAEANGVEVLNATPDSALKVFPRVSFEDLF